MALAARAASSPSGRGRLFRGKTAVKMDPRPSSDSTRTEPPSSASSLRTMESPSPVPPYSRVIDWSTWRKSSQMASRCSEGMPIPVSATATSTALPSAARRTRSDTRPPWVNFTALERRFSSTCFTLVRSVSRAGRSAGTSTSSSSPLARTIGSMAPATSRTSSARSTVSTCTGIRPASILARSRMSFTSSSRWLLELYMRSSASSWRAVSSP
ncbi:MAG TPA: hypothetical protein VFX98_00155 [Longimicrobiaceae bacterium]|nr:hypothetical protein [Longimicrobiaceae bacterium]